MIATEFNSCEDENSTETQNIVFVCLRHTHTPTGVGFQILQTHQTT